MKNAQQRIAQLCNDYGVKQSFGSRLRPLVERALECDEEKRARLLGLVERSFAEEASRKSQIAESLPLTEAELEVLSTVGRILHDWMPPQWVDQWQPSGEGPGEVQGPPAPEG